MSNRPKIKPAGDPLNDTISVIYPAPPDWKPTTDVVTRREFLARMDGFDMVDQVRNDRTLRVVALMDVDMLQQWLDSR